MARFDDERKELIDLLRSKGITDEAVLTAMYKVERHLFVEPMYVNRAYEDNALPIGSQQTISQPYTVAFMTQALRLQKDMKVLEIGTGSGYQAAVIAMLGCRVFTIERHISLANNARRIFDALNLRIAAKGGDGTVGWSEHAPYDAVIVTAGAPHVPDALVQQLKEGGRIAIPVGDRESQQLVIGTRKGNGLVTEIADGFKFVPLIGKNGWN
ncbi:MAG: protein-L-isoaspartate(D-aspartate) O-methyltransferase [Bacteroidetes bacterium]|nr:protein-L-isoaspartate(D-aspartate) O-methyltransferase [Bacteroidota bacterium]